MRIAPASLLLCVLGCAPTPEPPEDAPTSSDAGTLDAERMDADRVDADRADAGMDAPAGADAPSGDAGAPSRDPIGIWLSPAEIALLPTSGAAWDAVLEAANTPLGAPDLSDQDQVHNVLVLARALVYVRLGDERYRTEVRAACMMAMGTEDGGRTLALGRELFAYVVAADLVGLEPAEDAAFRAWLDAVRREDLSGDTLVSTHDDRPNNWGTHAGASRMAAAIYLGDDADLARSAEVFRGWLGERAVYAGFRYGELDWQCDPMAPVGINPAGCMRDGHSIDGVLADDQRRTVGGFSWPPPRENYVWEGLQGAVVQAELLARRGYDSWEWSDPVALELRLRASRR